MLNWYMQVLSNYAGFSGRARRAEYWNFFLVNLIVAVVLEFVLGLLHLQLVAYLYSLAVLIPSIAVGVRRMHDTNRSGWWLLIALIPFAGWLAVLILLALEGTPGANQYGPDPKATIATVPA